MLKFDRAIELLRIAVDHIKSFEEDMSSEVLASLGFTEDELVTIQTKIEILPKDKENVIYVDGWDVHNGQVYWMLNHAGNEFIFSDEVYADGIFITENVPFKNYSHYIFEKELDNGSTKYFAYAWYNNKESYMGEFFDLNEALDWLVPKLDFDSLDVKIRSCENTNNPSRSQNIVGFVGKDER